MSVRATRSGRLTGVLSALLALAGVPATPAAARETGPAADLQLKTFDFAWQRIADSLWDEALDGVDWQAVGEELRPRAQAAADARELREVLEEMLSRLGLSHFGVLPGSFEPSSAGEATGAAGSCAAALMRVVAGDGGSAASDAGPGLEVRFIGSMPVVSRVAPESSARRSGVVAGLRVVRLEGQDMSALDDCLGIESLDSGAAAMVRSRAVEGLLHGDEGTAVTVELEDPGGVRTSFELGRAHHPDAVEIGFGNLPPMRHRFETEVLERDGRRILVVRFNSWLIPVVRAFEEALYGDTGAASPIVDGLLVDLRGNPGGLAGTAPGVAGYLLQERVDLGQMKNGRTNLRLTVFPREVSSRSRKIEGFTGPVALLVDGRSASTSEIFAAGLQDHGRARLFGEPTAAAALPAVLEKMPNGDLLMRAVADFERPSGEPVEGRPVEPDVRVPLTREGLLGGQDEPLEVALRWLDSELAATAAAR